MSDRREYAPGEFCWIDLAARDHQTAAAFYAAVFGWDVAWSEADDHGPYGEFLQDGEPIAGIGELSAEMQADGVPPAWNTYIAVDDIDRAAGRASELGGDVFVPPLTIPGAGRLAFLRDPSGATVALWQAEAHTGCARSGVPGTRCWNELATRDLAAAEAFFGPLCGWSFRDNPDSPTPYRIIHGPAGDQGGLLQMTAAWGEMPPHWTVYFAVEDADAALDRVRAAGGQVYCSPFAIPGGRIAVLADPQGAVFNVWEHRATGDAEPPTERTAR